MNLPMYENKQSFSRMPHERYIEHMQALINNRWKNSTQTGFRIWQEEPYASNEWKRAQISVDTAIDIGTGFKKGDDFKVFSHRDISKEIALGTMFKTETDYWLCINTNAFASTINSCEVRRCNNVLKWINPLNGFIYEQMCCVDYEYSSPQPSKDKDVVVASGHIFVLVQGNDLTRSLRKNQRFIFNGQAFKLMAWQTLLNDEANKRDSNLLYLDLYLDLENPSDDLINNVANATDYVYSIDINPDFVEQVQGFKGQLSATVMLGNEVVDRKLVWEGDKNVQVGEDGTYTLVGVVGSKAIISVHIDGNPDLVETHTITIVDSMQDNYEIVVSPLFSEVRQKLPQKFSVYLYNNGIRLDGVVDCQVSGLDASYYSLIQDDHDFELSAKKIAQKPLTLTFSVGDTTKAIDVIMKPFF